MTVADVGRSGSRMETLKVLVRKAIALNFLAFQRALANADRLTSQSEWGEHDCHTQAHM